MPKNKGKGGKNRRRGKNESEEKRQLNQKQAGQEYGQVLRMLGNGRLECYCFDGKKRMCHIRGKMRKRVWVNQGDIILIGLRDFQDDKADVIQKYNADEARQLKKIGAIPPETNIEEGEQKEGDDDVPFDFTGAIKDSDDDDDDTDVGTQPDRYKDLPEFSDSDDDDDEIDLAAL